MVCVCIFVYEFGLMAEKHRVCVTGARGFLASWLVKLLLSKDYAAHGTVIDPSDENHAPLKKLEKASETLKFFLPELLDYNDLYVAIKGCSRVFHVVSPVPLTSVSNPEVELVEPAVKGTLHVLQACSEANVKRVVAVSSGGTVAMNPQAGPGVK